MKELQFIEELQEKVLRLWNEGDTDLLDEIVSEDFYREEPFAGHIEGRDGMAEHVLWHHHVYPDIEISIEEYAFDGEILFNRWRFKGTHLRQPPDSEIMPTGKELDFLGTSFMHIKDGKMVDEYVYYNLLGVLQSLGLIPELAL